MADFQSTIATLPGLKDLDATGRDGLAERVLSQIVGAHRWPFLLKVQETFNWAANDSIQALPGMSRLWNVMYPDAANHYSRLIELSDIEFQKHIENSPLSTQTLVWRDAGYDGNNMQIELFSVPTTAKSLKLDYTAMPDVATIDSFPFRFQGLVIDGMMAMMGNYGAKVAYQDSLQRAISREMDLQGKRDRVGLDIGQASRLSYTNNPT